MEEVSVGAQLSMPNIYALRPVSWVWKFRLAQVLVITFHLFVFWFSVIRLCADLLQFSITNSTVGTSIQKEEDSCTLAGGVASYSLFTAKIRGLYAFHKSPWANVLHVEFYYPLSKKKHVLSWHEWEGSFFWPLLKFLPLPRNYTPWDSHRHILANFSHCQNIWGEKCIYPFRLFSPEAMSNVCLTRNSCVLVCLGCRNKMPSTGGLSKRCLFSHSFGDWKYGIRVPAWSNPGKGSLLGLPRAAFSLCPHMQERDRKLSGVSSLKGTNPTMRAQCSWPHLKLITSQKPMSKYHHIWDYGFNI